MNNWKKILFKNIKGNSFKYNGKLYELIGEHAAVTYPCINRPEYELFNGNEVIEVIDLCNEYNDITK